MLRHLSLYLSLFMPTIASFLTPTPFLQRTTLSAASSPEEDLELTRKLILRHITKLSRPPSTPPLLIRAALGEPVPRTPVWLFRQAGRHLPEYRAYKEKVSRGFWEMLKHPEDVAECTLQPLRRYDLDAAILFSDILVIPAAAGMEVIMPGGVGIQIPSPATGPEDLTRYNFNDRGGVLRELSHVIESAALTRKTMDDEGFDQPLIGFSAAPFTLLYYIMGGTSKKNPTAGSDFLRDHPEVATVLLRQLGDIIVDYVVAQVEAGAEAIQLFEAMGMFIDEKQFLEFAMPCLENIGREFKERTEGVPLMVFARGASYANEHLAACGLFDVITIDGSVERSSAREKLGGKSLQGNYDPSELIEDNGKTVESVRESTREMLEALGCEKLIANLGEGLGGKESTELVRAFVDAVHQESEDILALED